MYVYIFLDNAEVTIGRRLINQPENGLLYGDFIARDTVHLDRSTCILPSW